MKFKARHKPVRDIIPFWELTRAWYLNGQLGELRECSPDLFKCEDIHKNTPIGYCEGGGWAAFTDDGRGILVFNDQYLDDYLEGEFMKMGIAQTKTAKIRAKKERLRQECGEWRRVFAWKPVRVSENQGRWLEYVERRRKSVDGGFEYRAIN